MLESKKHVFWQALVFTIIFFILGLVFGVYIEQIRADDFSTSFYESEVSLYDSLALSQFSKANISSCVELRNSTLDFADRIYQEARGLERFDEKNKLTTSLKTVHRKYDLLRTLLWMNIIEVKGRCGEMNSVVYLYDYSTEDLNVKSEQVVWSKWLSDLKEEEGDKVVLIPIATDSNLISLNAMIRKFNVTQIPAVVVNEKNVFYDVRRAEEIKTYLK